MQAISVVIICKNEAKVISRTLESLQGLTDDIVVFDNGSNDNTTEVAKQFNVQLHQGSWEGFGKTKNKATALGRYDWILSIDADEAIDEELKQSILALELTEEHIVYELKFKNFLGDKYLKYGEWGNDKHIRLFNRKMVNWDMELVHERLIIPAEVTVKKLSGYVLHRTMKDIKDYALKMVEYAMLNAAKYHRMGKQSSWFIIRLAPGFAFLKYYVFKLGFLDGQHGYICAKMTAHYTFLKYSRLKELQQQNNK